MEEYTDPCGEALREWAIPAHAQFALLSFA